MRRVMDWISRTLFLYLASHFAAAGTEFRPSIELPPLVLGQGEQRLIKIPGLRRFSIGQPLVRAVKPPSETSDSERLLLRGMAPGITDLWTWGLETGHRSVIVEPWQPVHDPFQAALSKLEEIEIIALADQAVLRGSIHSKQEALRVYAIKKKFPAQVEDLTILAEPLVQDLKAELVTLLHKEGLADKVELKSSLDRITVISLTPDKKIQKQIEERVKRISPLIAFERESYADEAPTIFFRVFILAIKIGDIRSLGVGWPPEIPAALHATPFSIQNQLNLDLSIRALASQGSAKILSKPELAVRAPGEAELFAGGELPIRIQTKFTSTVIWKNFGLNLKLKTEKLAMSRIRLEISTEVSHLDSGIALEDIPGLRTNRMKTQIEAELGTPLLLSGLLQKDERKETTGVPLLKNIPVLGSLFGIQTTESEQSELVAILLPSREPPNTSPQSIDPSLPKGPWPPPRNWISADRLKSLKASREYPWNAFANE